MSHHSQDKDFSQTKVYLVGGGIASLASAVYLILEAGVPGANIHVMEQEDISGGALDGSGEEGSGYLIRGGRMHEKHYVCYWDLLSRIPSLEDPRQTVAEETFAFNKLYVSDAKARLLRAGEKLDNSSLGLSKKDQVDMLRLWFHPEGALDEMRIEDWFSADFFHSNFWLLWTTMFAFQKWSSLAEMRRYFIRFIHLLPGFHHLGGILRTKYNQYDSVVRPLETWLRGRGVQFDMRHQVINIEFDLAADQKTARVIHYRTSESEHQIMLSDEDFVFITNGSIVENSDVGSMDRAPVLKGKAGSGAWQLWERIAAQHPDFGNPEVFCDYIDLQKWESFTVTLKDPTFFEYMESFTGNVAGTGGLVTMTDSNWLMSVVLAAQPHFANQPEDVNVFWGYGLYPDREGNRVKKKMSVCSGSEILEELFHHLRITGLMRPVLEAGKANCLPVMMPFIDSLFMPRKRGDRPKVIPEDATNFAFLGQFAELPHDCVFTVEYSVRCAQTAVYALCDLDKEPNPIYQGHHDPQVLMKAVAALAR